MVAGGARAQQTLPRRHSRLTVAHDSGRCFLSLSSCLPKGPICEQKGRQKAVLPAEGLTHRHRLPPPPFPARATNTYTLSHVWASPGHGTQGLAEGLGKQNFPEPTAHLVPLPRISSSASRKPSLAYILAQDACVS